MRVNEANTPVGRLLMRLRPSPPVMTSLRSFAEPQRTIPTDQVLTIGNEALGLITDRLGGAEPHLEYRDPFGKWQPLPLEEAKGKIVDHISGAMKRDFDGGLLSVEVATYEGLPTRTDSRRHPLAPNEWVMNIAVNVQDRYGDGARFQTATHDGFLFIQRKRMEGRQVSLFIRQKR